MNIHMASVDLSLSGRDLVAAVTIIALVAGTYTEAIPESITITIIIAVLGGYGFTVVRGRRAKRKSGADSNGSGGSDGGE